MAYEDFKDLPVKTASDKALRDITFDVAKNTNYDEYQRGIALMLYKFFDKLPATLKEKGINSYVVFDNQRLAKELHKPIIRNFKKCIGYFPFMDSNMGAVIAYV